MTTIVLSARILRVLVLSDMHDKINKVKKIIANESFDVSFICGDFTYFRPLSEVIKYIELMRSTTKAPFYFVPGNCDPKELLDSSFEYMRFYNVHGKVIGLEKFQIAGVGGSGITPFNTQIEFTESEFREILRGIKSKIEPGKPLLLITHDPPYRTTDTLHSGESVGSVAIRSFVEEVRPLAVFSGHIHESRGMIKIADFTVVVNPGPAAHGFYAIVDLERDEVSVELKSIR